MHLPCFWSWYTHTTKGYYANILDNVDAVLHAFQCKCKLSLDLEPWPIACDKAFNETYFSHLSSGELVHNKTAYCCSHSHSSSAHLHSNSWGNPSTDQLFTACNPVACCWCILWSTVRLPPPPLHRNSFVLFLNGCGNDCVWRISSYSFTFCVQRLFA